MSLAGVTGPDRRGPVPCPAKQEHGYELLDSQSDGNF
jgi:hypothetical protein